MAVGNRIKVERIFDNRAIGASGSLNCIVDVQELLGSTDGKAAVQWYCASAGNADVDVTYQVSLDGATYFLAGQPASGLIKEAITPAGTNTSGCEEFDFQFAKYWKIIATETAAVAVTRFDLWIAFG